MKEKAFMASHTHFWALLSTRYCTVGIGVRLFIAAGGEERERKNLLSLWLEAHYYRLAIS